MEFSLKASTYWGRPTAWLTHSATLFPCKKARAINHGYLASTCGQREVLEDN